MIRNLASKARLYLPILTPLVLLAVLAPTVAKVLVVIGLVLAFASALVSASSARRAETEEEVDEPGAGEMLTLEQLQAAAIKVAERGAHDPTSFAPECSGLDVPPKVFAEFVIWITEQMSCSSEKAVAQTLGVLFGLQAAKDRPAAPEPAEVEQ